MHGVAENPGALEAVCDVRQPVNVEANPMAKNIASRERSFVFIIF
jgi:hypothetical protein